MTIPPHRLQIALHALVMIQVNKGHFTKHKQWAFDALQALDPDLALLPATTALAHLTENQPEEGPPNLPGR
jgi:hypothetical protein